MIYTQQSKIAELRDQLSLDFADGKYLNVVSSNLGLSRPPFGFSDDVWRAVVKAIALQYKQVNSQFEAVLEVVLGPKETQVSSFSEVVEAGARRARLVSTEGFPQTGTVVVDEGLPTEETLEYTYIDRTTNTIYFNSACLFQHEAISAVFETGISVPVTAGSVELPVYSVSGFPDPVSLGVNYPVVIGRGTADEYVDHVVAVSSEPQKMLTLQSGTLVAVEGPTATTGVLVTLEPLQSQEDSYYLTFEDVSALPKQAGCLQADLDVLYTATGGTTTSVTVTGPLPANSALTGYIVRFSGNVTAALTNRVGYITSNNSTDLLFDNTLAAAPAAGDQFSLIANFQYSEVLPNDQAVLLRSELPGLYTFAPSTKFTLVRPVTTVSVAQVQVKSGNWDVFQSDQNHVEILIPTDFLVHGPRSASYIRETGQHTGSSTANASRSIGDETLSVASTSSFPLVGVLEHVPGGFRYAYCVPHTWTQAKALAGATVLVVGDTSLFPSSGTARVGGSTMIYTVLSATELTVPALVSDVPENTLVRQENVFVLAKGLEASVASPDIVASHTAYDSGDYWNDVDVWPGPYVWDFDTEPHEKPTVPNNTLTAVVCGTSKLQVDKFAGDSVLEVENASDFPTAVPYSVRVGENSGNVEDLSVQQISFKSRTHTTLAAASLIGDSYLTVTSLSGPSGPGHTFPNASKYRVAVYSSPTSVQILTVVGTATGPNRLLLESPLTVPFTGTEAVVLLADLLTVSPAISDDHLGLTPWAGANSFYPPESQHHTADFVRPLYSSVSLSLSPVDFSTDGASMVVNFGNRILSDSQRLTSSATAGTASLVVADSTGFPTTYPYTVTVGVGLGPLYQDRFTVSNNNTGTGTLTLSHNLKWTYPAGTVISFTPGPEERIRYTSRSGSSLNFSAFALFNHTHYVMEHVAPTVGTGFPRTNGYDFPLRLPVSLEDRLRFLVDLVRAAGIKVSFVSKR